MGERDQNRKKINGSDKIQEQMKIKKKFFQKDKKLHWWKNQML